MSIELIGWISAACFAFCGAPAALDAYKNGHARGINLYMLWLWMIGEILAIGYVLGKHGFDLPLLTNYALNFVFLCIILRFKHFERK